MSFIKLALNPFMNSFFLFFLLGWKFIPYFIFQLIYSFLLLNVNYTSLSSQYRRSYPGKEIPLGFLSIFEYLEARIKEE